MNYNNRGGESPKRWTPAQHAMLQTMRADGASWEDIAKATGHSVGSCSTTLSMLKRQTNDTGVGKRTVNRRPWSVSDIKILIQMRGTEERPFPDIDRALNRPEGSSSSKWHSLRVPGVTVPFPEPEPERVPPAPIYHTSLTAELCGDPLPGRSALDRKRAESGVSP